MKVNNIKHQVVKPTLLIPMGMLCMGMHVHAADDTVLTENILPDSKLVAECAKVVSDAGRLACFDKVASTQELPSFTRKKIPLDIDEVVRTTIDGIPEVPLFDRFDNKSGEKQNVVEDKPKQESDNKKNVDAADAILAKVGVQESDVEQYSPLSLAYDLDRNSEVGTWKLRPYNAMYIMPFYQHVKPNRNPSSPSQEAVRYSANQQRSSELKYQLSFKTKVAQDLLNSDADIWFGYTQQSHWQIFNEDNSHPFRATDYMPEFFLTYPATADLPFGGKVRMVGAGIIHHSNGEQDPLSRSWNRMYALAGAEWDNLTVITRLTKRLEAKNGSKPDDNADIEDFYGFGDVQAFYDFNDKDSLGAMFRISPSTGKGAIQLDYTRRLDSNVNAYLQLFHGYGESIIDYNHANTTIGVGLMLNDWKGL